MSIKNVKPTNERFKQGYFSPVNPSKYSGDFPIIYRSSWERKFMDYCDLNENVLSWASEKVQIPYISPIDNRTHTYNVDFWVVIKTEEKYKKFLVEIKPSSSLKSPKPITGRQTEKKVNSYIYEATQFALNKAKFTYADIYAKERGCEFVVLTEKELFKDGRN